MKNWLIAALIAMGTFGFTAVGAVADNDDDDDDFDRKRPVITQVTVSFDDPRFGDPLDLLIVNGRDLAGRPEKDETQVFIGGRGPLEVLSSSGGELIVQCVAAPDFECNDGDYKLEVAIVPVKRNGWRDWEREDDDGHSRRFFRSRIAHHDLTIGAVGPAGPEGPRGPAGGSSGALPIVFTVTLSTDTTTVAGLSISTLCPADAKRVGCGGATGGDGRALTRLVGINPIGTEPEPTGCSSDGVYEGGLTGPEWFLRSTSICMRLPPAP